MLEWCVSKPVLSAGLFYIVNSSMQERLLSKFVSEVDSAAFDEVTLASLQAQYCKTC